MTASQQRIGRRGAALLFFAFLDLVYCWSLLTPSAAARDSPSLRFIAGIAPLWVWAGLWGAVGLVCLCCAFLRRDQVGFTAAIAIKVMWGLLLVGAQAVGGVDRGYVSAAVWLALALLVGLISGWPEPPREVR